MATLLAADEIPVADAGEKITRFGHNADYAESRWEELLPEQAGYWFVVYGERKELIGKDVSSLIDQVPAEDRDTMVLLFLERAPKSVLL